MKWSLSQLKKYTNHTLELDEKVQFNEISNRRDVVSIGVTSVGGTMHVGATRVTFNLDIETSIVMLDSRTTEEITVPISVQSTEIFDELQDPDEESDDNIHFVDHTIDLTAIVRELIVISIPTQYTKSDTLVESSGENWSVISEEELEKSSESEEKAIDPRLSKLQSLFGDVEKESKED